MTEEKELSTEEVDDFIAAEGSILFAVQSVLRTFCTAVVRAHDDPARLLEALERTIEEDHEGETPFTELTPPNQTGRNHAQAFEEMLVRILRNRVQAAAQSAG